MAIVMDEKFFADSLGFDDEAFGAIWPESNDLTNDPIA